MESNYSNIGKKEFDFTVGVLLDSLGAQKYVDIFRQRNIDQCTLTELSDEDLIILGVDSADIRKKLLEEVKNLPICDEPSIQRSKSYAAIGPIEIADILQDSSEHLYRIYLSILSNTLALKKTDNLTDCILYEDKYASNVALTTMCDITNILNSMDIAVHTQLKGLLKKSKSTTKKKKIVVGTVGTAVIAILAMLFARSLKQL